MPDFAMAIARYDGMWEAALLPERLVENLPDLLTALRQQGGEDGVIGLVDVADEFFVAVRLVGSDTRILLSDLGAAAAWDLAAQVVGHLGLEPPGDEDLDEALPAGDLDLFADLGIDATEMDLLLTDVDAYADETLGVLARRLGFADAYERVVEPVLH